MKTIEVINRNVLGTVSEADINSLQARADEAMEKLHKGTGAGNDFLGWLHLPSETPETLLDDINATAAQFADCEYVVAIGIGGSYLGAKAVIEALSDSFVAYKPANGPRVLFAGQNIGEDYLHELKGLLAGKKFGIIVISKSGTTTEPAIAFRMLREMLESQEGKAFAATHIVAITDAHKGALRKLATEEGYKTFVVHAGFAALISCVCSKVKHVPYICAPHVRMALEAAEHEFVIVRLIFFRVVAAPGMFGVQVRHAFRAVLRIAEATLGIKQMEEGYPQIVEEESGHVPAEIEVPRNYVRDVRRLVGKAAHCKAGERRKAGRVELMNEVVKLFMECQHILLVLVVHRYLVGNAPHNYARVVVLLVYELFHLRLGICICFGHMAGDIGDFRPYYKSRFVAEVIEIIVVLVVRKP